MSKDAWEGDSLWPQTFNGWNYVEESPINKTDPSGRIPVPRNDCQACRPRGAFDGYSESDLTMLVFGRSITIQGRELVFDFATLEMAEFNVHSDFDYPGLDIGLLSFERIYDVSFIKGFTPEPGDHLLEDYGPRVVNASLGGSLGLVIHIELGLHGWVTEDLTLSGGGGWYGGEVAGLDVLLHSGLVLITGIPIPVSVGPEFSYHKTYTSLLNYSNLGDDICSEEEASKMLRALQIYPNYSIGQWPARQMAIQHFKSYASLD